MKINVKIRQEDAIKAGSNQFGILEVEVDISKLSPAQRDMLAEEINNRDKVLYFCAAATEAAVIELLQKKVEHSVFMRAEDERKLQDEINRVLAMSDNKFDQENTSWWWDHSKVEADPRVRQRMIARDGRLAIKREAIIRDLLNINNPDTFLFQLGKHRGYMGLPSWLETDLIRDKENLSRLWCDLRNKEAKEAAEAAEQAAKARREAQISEWVYKKGTANQQARHAIGLLPEQEVIDCIRDEVFQPLAEFARYERMTRQGICECAGYTCETTFDVDDAKDLTAEQYDVYEKVKELMPEATLEPRLHSGKGVECESVVERYALLVTVVVGELKLSREYALPERIQ